MGDQAPEMKWLRTLGVFVVVVGCAWALTFAILRAIYTDAPPLDAPYPAHAPLPSVGFCQGSNRSVAPTSASPTDLGGLNLRGEGLWEDAAERGCMFSRDDFLALPEAFSETFTNQLYREANASLHLAHRRGVFSPGKGEAIPYEVVKQRMPMTYSLYKSPEFVDYLSQIFDDKVIPSIEEDPHAAAIYWYDRAGDGINWHYDTSFFEGRRYTVLLTLLDNSSSRLHVQLYTKNASAQTQDVVVQTKPGTMIVFNGDQVKHRLTAMTHNEVRMVLTMEYVTSHNANPATWMIYRLSQWGGYFGFPTELVIGFYATLLALSYYYVNRTSTSSLK